MKTMFLGFLALAIISVGLYSQADQKSQPGEIKIQPVIVNQIVSEDGTPLVEIIEARCEATPKRLESYSCRVRNNSGKEITALALIWAITWSDGHSEHSENQYRFTDWVFNGELAGLAPGNEASSESSGPLWVEGNEFIKSIRVSVDYVEFADKSSLGSDHSGASRRFALTRLGAKAYREWLLGIYQERGSKGVMEELTKERGDNFVELPDEPRAGLGSVKGDKELFRRGATIYRNWLLRQVYSKQGLEAVIQKLLSDRTGQTN